MGWNVIRSGNGDIIATMHPTRPQRAPSPLGAWALMSALLTATPAAAQDVNLFRPAAGGGGYLTVASGQTEAVGQLSAALYGGVADRPLVERDADGAIIRPRIARLVGVEALLSYGLTERIELGVGVPAAHVSGAGLADSGDEGLAAGDIRLLPRLRLLGAHAPLGLTVGVPITIPVGDEVRHLGSGGVTVGPVLAAERRWGPVAVALNGGYRYRAANDRLANVGLDDALTYGLAAGLHLGGQARGSDETRWRLMAEVVGSTEVGDVPDDTVTSPLEALGALRYATDWGARFTLGGGVGITPDIGAPVTRVIAGVGWRFEPEAGPSGPAIVERVIEGRDQDGDGLIDTADACPTEPETWNGIADRDGCPDSAPTVSVDRVVVARVVVEPIEQPEPVAPPERPEPTGPIAPAEPIEPAAAGPQVRVTDGALEIDEEVQFDSDKAVIRPESAALLDAVAAIIRGRDDLGPILIEGHTDDVGDAKRNLRLSRDRAYAVRDALIARGVRAEGLWAVGYGESRPLVDGRTTAARARNRRVRFARATEAELPRALEEVSLETIDDDTLVFGLRADRPLPLDGVLARAVEGGAVLIIRVPGVQVDRKWMTGVAHRRIKRALLHPSVQTPPAAVLRVRFARPLSAAARRGLAVQIEGDQATVIVPR